MRMYMLGCFGRLPAELWTVIKPVFKKSGLGDGAVSGVQTTEDSLWLFSEVEVLGRVNHSVAGEGSGYPLFTSDKARIKTVGGASALWWLRSPTSGSSTYFCIVEQNGPVARANASVKHGVAYGFCI